MSRLFNLNFADLLAYLVERTRDLFFRGYPLVDLMPADVRPDIELFVRGGLAILGKIERQHYNVLSRRPVSPSGRGGPSFGRAVGHSTREAPGPQLMKD